MYVHIMNRVSKSIHRAHGFFFFFFFVINLSISPLAHSSSLSFVRQLHTFTTTDYINTSDRYKLHLGLVSNHCEFHKWLQL
jgi:hypothetical protein